MAGIELGEKLLSYVKKMLSVRPHWLVYTEYLYEMTEPFKTHAGHQLGNISL